MQVIKELTLAFENSQRQKSDEISLDRANMYMKRYRYSNVLDIDMFLTFECASISQETCRCFANAVNLGSDHPLINYPSFGEGPKFAPQSVQLAIERL